MTPATPRSNHQIIQDHYAASARQDLAGMLADVAEDVRWTEAAGFPCAGTRICMRIWRLVAGSAAQ